MTTFSDAANALQEQIKLRFAQLPKVVQDAILSADVEVRMRQLAAQHQLHFDQWTALENEVMFALLGFQPVDSLAANIEKEVGVPHAIALALASDISEIVFKPIRGALQSGLENREQRTENSKTTPGTPSAPPPEGKAIRTPLSTDPYREAAV